MHIDMMMASIGITSSLYRVQQQAENSSIMRRVYMHDESVFYELLSGLPNQQTRKMERSVFPHLGVNLDILA